MLSPVGGGHTDNGADTSQNRADGGGFDCSGCLRALAICCSYSGLKNAGAVIIE